MSWQRSVLNSSLRLMEKPHLARVQSPSFLRTSADFKAGLWFHPPRGTSYRKERAGGVDLTIVTTPHSRADRIVLFVHGGGYVFGSARTHRALVAQLCARLNATGYLPDYRLAPEHPFPAGVLDVRAIYDHLLSTGVAANRILLAGDSAGGGLALGLLTSLLQENAPLPRAVLALSPFTDMTFSGQSLVENRHLDVLLPAGRARETAAMYLDGHDPTDPRVSPLFGVFHGAPPVYLAVGTTEILRDDTLRLARVLQDQGVAVELEVQEDLPHVWPLFHGFLPEAGVTLDRIADWVRPLWSSEGES